TCVTINGAHEDDVIEEISFDDVHITYEGGGTAEEATREVPAIAGEYFEIGTPPAYGLYARNVRGLTMNNVRLQVQNADLRPAVVFDRVNDAAVTALAVDGNPGADATIRMTDSANVL